jgi:uncharacterized membrane protein
VKPLFVLLISFGIALLAVKIFDQGWNFIFAGNFAMSVMLLFTAMGHFAFSKGMMMMLPDFIPFKRQIIYGTGIIEILAAIGLFIPSYRHLTSIALVIFFVLILPSNIYATIKKVNYQKGTYDGNGVNYLLFRIPLQIFFIEWVWYFGMLR